jgi:hypothetical protein
MTLRHWVIGFRRFEATYCRHFAGFCFKTSESCYPLTHRHMPEKCNQMVNLSLSLIVSLYEVWGSGVVAPRILSRDTGLRYMVSFKSWTLPPSPGRRCLWYVFDMRLDWPQGRFENCKKTKIFCPCRESHLRYWVVYPVVWSLRGERRMVSTTAFWRQMVQTPGSQWTEFSSCLLLLVPCCVSVFTL